MVDYVYMRVDGNEIIATGHVMRCLPIAEQIRLLNSDCSLTIRVVNSRHYTDFEL